MIEHQHYDLADAETKMRASIATALEEADHLIKKGDIDGAFVKAMRYFDEARIQFSLGGMKATNEGVDRNEMLAAAGYTLGSIMGSVLLMTVGARERDIIKGWMQQALAQNIGAQAAAKTMNTILKPMAGGRA